MNTIKHLVKNSIRFFGWDLRRYCQVNPPEGQLVKALKLISVDVVFDIGANEGQFAREIRGAGYIGKIVSFEPLSAAREKLLTFASVDPNWEVHHQAAIGDEDGEVKINISGNSVSSSVLPMLDAHSNAAMGSAYIGVEHVPLERVDSLASRYLTSESNLFIKIDTQGFEWKVLDGALDTMKRARGVFCELSLVPLYDGQQLWWDIINRLESEGFMLWTLQQGFTDNRTGQSLQMDGIFLRRDVLQKV
jgi:FkbM family methyltransferase